jgi:hypothetical protein
VVVDVRGIEDVRCVSGLDGSTVTLGASGLIEVAR